MCVCVLLTLIHNKPDSSSSDLEDASTAMPLRTPHRKCLAPSAMTSQEVSRSRGDHTGSAEVHLWPPTGRAFKDESQLWFHRNAIKRQREPLFVRPILCVMFWSWQSWNEMFVLNCFFCQRTILGLFLVTSSVTPFQHNSTADGDSCVWRMYFRLMSCSTWSVLLKCCHAAFWKPLKGWISPVFKSDFTP